MFKKKYEEFFNSLKFTFEVICIKLVIQNVLYKMLYKIFLYSEISLLQSHVSLSNIDLTLL